MIRRLEEADLPAVLALRREALLSAPTAFSSSPATDVGLDPEVVLVRLRPSPAQAMFGVFDPDLAGTVRVERNSKEKEAHRAGVFGMYVRPAHRRQGLGAALLAAAIEFARSLPGVTHLHLTVSAMAGAARRLYERAGFTTWGIEPEAFRVEGVFIATHHMILRMDGDDLPACLEEQSGLMGDARDRPN